MRRPIPLSPSEAVCLEALRSGADRPMRIALRARLNLWQTSQALAKLASLGLATTDGDRTWTFTPRGKRADVMIAPAVRRRGRKPTTGVVPGGSAARLVALLDRPRRGAELAALLGVTRQRVHQLIVGLSAFGLIRFADPNNATFVIALKDDASILLRPDQERVLSAFPETSATTLSRIAQVKQVRAEKIATVVESLRLAGLIEKTGTATQGDLFRLTAAGSAHWQRSTTARHADAPRLPFRSDRIHKVLSYLESQGPARTRDICRGLKLEPTSMNALMQYLKRKNAVRTQTDARLAPYDLTPDGREMLAAMKRAGLSGHSRSRSGGGARSKPSASRP
jgi:DNA-binding MarR family transcriptional regulator